MTTETLSQRLVAGRGPATVGVPRTATALVLAICAADLLLHVVTANRYGIFRDELYYVACSQHLAWGYVDHPPGVVFIAWLATHLFGHSALALRLFPALAGAALVWVTAQLARQMGGGRFAQGLAALAIIPVPLYLILQHWITMNAFEPLLWMAGAWLVLRSLHTGDPRYWFWFGVLAGITFEFKYSIAFLLAGIFVGILLTPERRFLKSGWLWLGVAACAVIALPNFLWQLSNGFPFLELMHNIRMGNRDIVRGPFAFIADQLMIMGPMLAPLWIGGLAWLFLSREGRRFRILGIAFVVVLLAFIAMHGKNYYVSPVYPMLFAAGAVGFERLTERRFGWLKPAYVAVVVILGALMAPMFCPILSPETFLRYEAALHFQPPQAERQNNGPLPQYFADEFGWPEMVEKVARVYNSLPPAERARTAIFANGWGEAAAVDFYGPRYGLPRAISKHNNYWLWGPRDYTGDIVIVLGSDGRGDREHFESVEPAGQVGEKYSRRDEWFTIWLCRGLKGGTLAQYWPRMKKYN